MSEKQKNSVINEIESWAKKRAASGSNNMQQDFHGRCGVGGRGGHNEFLKSASEIDFDRGGDSVAKIVGKRESSVIDVDFRSIRHFKKR